MAFMLRKYKIYKPNVALVRQLACHHPLSFLHDKILHLGQTVDSATQCQAKLGCGALDKGRADGPLFPGLGALKSSHTQEQWEALASNSSTLEEGKRLTGLEQRVWPT